MWALARCCALPILPRLGSATLTPLRPRPHPFVQTWNRRSFLRRALHVSLVPVRMGHYSIAPAAGLRAAVRRWEHSLHFEIMMNFARRDETPLHEKFVPALHREHSESPRAPALDNKWCVTQLSFASRSRCSNSPMCAFLAPLHFSEGCGRAAKAVYVGLSRLGMGSGHPLPR